MRKPTLLIVEDHHMEGRTLSSILLNLGYTVLDVIPCYDDFLEEAPALHFDLLIVDIELGERGNTDGFLIVQKMKDRVPIIIHSDHNNQETWNYTYSSKHIRQVGRLADAGTWLPTINTMLNDFYSTPNSKAFALPSGKSKGQEFVRDRPFYLKKEGEPGKTRIMLSDIHFITTKGDVKGQLRFFTKYGLYTTSKKLDEVAEKWHDPNLVRIHKSYLVNWRRQQSIDLGKRLLYLHTSQGRFKIPIGQTYLPFVKKLMG